MASVERSGQERAAFLSDPPRSRNSGIHAPNQLAPVAQQSDEDLRSALDQLVGAGLVFRRGNPPHATFQIKHALVQDTAYATLLRTKRQELHARIVEVLEQQFPSMAESMPGTMARHCTAAGSTDK